MPPRPRARPFLRLPMIHLKKKPRLTCAQRQSLCAVSERNRSSGGSASMPNALTRSRSSSRDEDRKTHSSRLDVLQTQRPSLRQDRENPSSRLTIAACIRCLVPGADFFAHRTRLASPAASYGNLFRLPSSSGQLFQQRYLASPKSLWWTREIPGSLAWNQRPPDESPSHAAGGQFKQLGRHRARPVPYVLRREPSPRSVSRSPVTKTHSVLIHFGGAHGFAFRRTGVSVGHGLKLRRPQPETTRGPRRLPAWQNLKTNGYLSHLSTDVKRLYSHIEEV
jgi:hypothetical protein